MKQSDKIIRIIDRAILIFILVFLASLTNSIFFNQIGYFGALFLILVRYAITRKNPFKKTGLEIFFLLFILVEFFSALQSLNEAQAFHNLFKRFLMIPIVYVMVISTDDMDKAKLFFKIYLGAAIITMLGYLGFSISYFLTSQYIIMQKGPSPFQYVMTAGGLMSFTVIFLFAFLLNEKKSIYRKLALVIFPISVIALAASYTRAAWMGTAAGLLLVIVLTRKWYLLIAGAVLVVLFMFLSPNQSSVHILELKDDSAKESLNYSTNGRAYSVLPDSSFTYVSDYENGLIKYLGNKPVEKISFPSPVTNIFKWKPDYFVAGLMDSRFYLLKKDRQNNLKIMKEFVTPGLTLSSFVFDSLLYVCDMDSGITIFKNPDNLQDTVRIKDLQKVKYISISNGMFACSNLDDYLYVYSLKDGIPSQKVYMKKFDSEIGAVYLDSNKLYLSGVDGLILMDVNKNKLNTIEKFKNIRNIVSFFPYKEGFYSFDVLGKGYKFENTDSLKITNFYNLKFSPFYVNMVSDKFYITKMKRNRLGSIVDPYHFSNNDRINMAKTGIEIFKKYPVLGIGDIDITHVFAEYKKPYQKENFGHFHNNYVHLLVILGVIGFIIAMALLIKVLVVHIKIYAAVRNIDFVSSFSLGALASFVGFLVSGIAEWNFGDQEIITMIWFILGLNLAFFRYSKLAKERNTTISEQMK